MQGAVKVLMTCTNTIRKFFSILLHFVISLKLERRLFGTSRRGALSLWRKSSVPNCFAEFDELMDLALLMIWQYGVVPSPYA